MAVPGLLIEYLVSGAVSLVWLLPLIRDSLVELPAVVLTALALGLYVIGMVVDVLGWVLTWPLKPWIRRRVYKKYGRVEAPETESGTRRHTKIRLYAPELAKELNMRSSRDRIARGLIVNAILATFFVSPSWIGAALIPISVVLWGMFEKLSFMFELCAEDELSEKLERGAAKAA